MLYQVYLVKNSTTDSGSSGPYSVILSQGSGGISNSAFRILARQVG